MIPLLLRLVHGAAAVLIAVAAHAAGPGGEAAARAGRLAAELRCVVCQNQSLAESSAPLAVDLRRQIEELAAAGRSDREIVEYLTARYGDFIRYRPPFDVRTLVLWLGPALMLFGGALWLRRVIVASRSGSAAGDLSDAERALAGRLLAVEPRSKPR